MRSSLTKSIIKLYESENKETNETHEDKEKDFLKPPLLIDLRKQMINEKNNEIVGNVIYIDNYENVVTNISKTVFKKFGKSRSYIINARNYKFNTIVNSYSQSIKFEIDKNVRKEEGKKIVIFNKAGFLELAIYKSNPSVTGGASSLFGLKYGDIISIKFD